MCVSKKGSHPINIGQQQTYLVPFYPWSHITMILPFSDVITLKGHGQGQTVKVKVNFQKCSE